MRSADSNATPTSSFWSQLCPRVIKSIEDAISHADADLRAVSSSIHAQPELGWEEHHAHDVLTAFMEKSGFQVERHAYGLDTAWKATYEVGQGGKVIGFNSEMDALAGIGHACGHNLIAISGCAAAIGVAAALREHDIPGKVVLLGTPAEEGGGGKTELLALGAYDGMEACLMVHPGSHGNGSASLTSTCIAGFTVTYTGKSAHAGGAPETAINALDAAVAAYVNVSVLRQQIPATSRVHGIIAGSEGWSTNVIPGEAKVKYGIRAPTAQAVISLVPRVLACFRAAALSTGCTYEITRDNVYLELEPCTTLERYYQEHCRERWGREGYEVPERIEMSASTDFGDVTYRVPGLHPMFLLPNAHKGEFPHSGSYASAAIAPEAHAAALKASSAIAVVGARVIMDREFGQLTRDTWMGQMEVIRAEETVSELEELMRPYRKVARRGACCVWDPSTQRLYFVDIDGRKVYTYEPASGTCGYERFKGRVSSIALRKGRSGLIATTEHTFELITSLSLPFPPTSCTATPTITVLIQPTTDLTPSLASSLRSGTNRFNEAACDPAGRLLAGTMGFEIGEVVGRVYSLEAGTGEDGTLEASSASSASSTTADDRGGGKRLKLKTVLDDVTCTNGMGWTRDGKIMYFTDSWIATIFRFDYDVATGTMTNRQVFSNLDVSQWGYPDGLCMDADDHVWSARWQGGKVVRLKPNTGQVDVVIDFPGCWNMTCCVFGGPDMTDLYVTSASSELSGDDPKDKPQGGDLFVVKGLGYKGVERHRCNF